MDCSPPGSSVHGILQAWMLEWVAMPSSRGSSQPRDQTQVSHIAGGFFTIWATREALEKGFRIITHRKNLEKHALYLMSALFPTPQHTRSHCPSMQADCLLPSRWVIHKGTDMSFPDGMLRAGYRYLHNYGEVGESSQITRKNTFRYLKHRYCKYIVSFFITISLVFAMFW